MIRISNAEDESTYFYFENRVFFEYLEKSGSDSDVINT